jgi:hypothetical protein
LWALSAVRAEALTYQSCPYYKTSDAGFHRGLSSDFCVPTRDCIRCGELVLG